MLSRGTVGLNTIIILHLDFIQLGEIFWLTSQVIAAETPQEQHPGKTMGTLVHITEHGQKDTDKNGAI